MTIKATRRRRLVSQQLLAVEDVDHLVIEVVARHSVHLKAGALDVSQPLLDADMERHHVHVWDASHPSQDKLQRRRVYRSAVSAHLWDSFALKE